MKLNHCENEVIANNSCYQLADSADNSEGQHYSIKGLS